MIQPAVLHISGNSENGPVSWLLHTQWAELVFITWALTHHPEHPQLPDSEWLPAGWVDHTRQSGALSPPGDSG